MPDHRQITDFRYALGGRLPDDFEIVTGEARSPFLVRSYDADAPESSRLYCASTSSTLAAVKWKITEDAAAPAHQDQEALCQVQFFDDGNQYTIVLRGAGISPSTFDGYVARLSATGNIRILKVVNGAVTAIATSSGVDIGYGVNWLRFRALDLEGEVALSAKLWPVGTEEPGPWSVQGSDATDMLADGWIGLASAATVRYEVNLFSFATNADVLAPPGLAEIPRSFAEALQDQGADMVWSSRVESLDLDSSQGRVDWYANRVRNTGALDSPTSTLMPALLADARPASESLSADLLFSGRVAGAASSVTYHQNSDLAFTPEGRTYAGRRHTLYLGESSLSHRWHVPVATFLMDGEPDIRSGDGTAVFTLTTNSAPSDRARDLGVARVADPIEVRRFLGIPTCLRGSRISVPANAAFQIKSFTAMMHFQVATAPGSAQRLASLDTSSTARQFRLEMLADGVIQLTASVGGTANAVNLTTAKSYVGSAFPWIAVTVDRSRRECCLVTESEALVQGMSGDIDTPSDTLIWGSAALGDRRLDCRFYNVALSVSEVRARAERRDDNGAGLVAYWPCEDGSGAVVTDTVGSNDGGLTGTSGIDYFWEASDLGEPEQAGTLMPWIEGHVFNAAAVLCDEGRNRWRFSDRAIPLDATSGNKEITVSAVKSQGVALTVTTDYTLPDLPDGAVVDFVAGGDDAPITVDTSFWTTPYAGGLLPDLLAGIGLRRGGLDLDRDLDPEAWKALRALCPWPAGFAASGQAPALEQLWAGALAGVGGHLRDDRFGRVLPWRLDPPINPGPYGMAPHLEFLGSPGGGIRFPRMTALETGLAAQTIVFWVKAHNVTGDPVAAEATFPSSQTIFSTLTPTASGGLVAGMNATLDGSIIWGAPGVTSQDAFDSGLPYSQIYQMLLRSGEWWLMAVKTTLGNGSPAPVGNYQRTIYGAPLGASAVRELYSQTVHGTPAAGGSLRIGGGPLGGFAGSIAWFAAYDDDLGIEDFNPMLSAPPTTDHASLYVPLNEGQGSEVVDQISGAVGTVAGARWCPQLQIEGGSSKKFVVSSCRSARPAWNSEVRYRKNQAPLQESEISASITNRAQRAELRDPDRMASIFDRRTRGRYLQARDQKLEAPVLSDALAQEVARLVAARFSPGQLSAVLGIDLRVLSARLCDEIWMRDTASGLPEWRPWRLVERNPPSVGNSEGSIALWGGKAP